MTVRLANGLFDTLCVYLSRCVFVCWCICVFVCAGLWINFLESALLYFNMCLRVGLCVWLFAGFVSLAFCAIVCACGRFSVHWRSPALVTAMVCVCVFVPRLLAWVCIHLCVCGW